MFKYRMIAALIFVLAAIQSFASVVGSVRGIVHDPQHRPLDSATITLTARGSDYRQTTTTNSAGEFAFAAVPAGEYEITVVATNFRAAVQSVQVTASAAPVLHFQLAVATQSQTVEVTDSGEGLDVQPATGMVSSRDIARTPGATRTNSLAMITNFVPGAYMVHDQLHVRGGHQVSWMIDGIPVPNTNIASNVGPQIDPKDIDYLEVQRGDYSAEFGDRAYGVFNAVTHSGFERNREGELILNYGSYNQTNSQINAGDHTQTFAWYASLSGNRTDVGLETPTPEVLHDMNSGVSGFLSLIWNKGNHDQFRVVSSARNDFYQVPNTPEQQAAGVADTEREHDVFLNGAWVHTTASNTVFTLAPFYHLNHAAYDGSAADDPVIPVQDRTSQYAGVFAAATLVKAKNTLRLGTQMYAQHDNAFFGVTCSESGLTAETCGPDADPPSPTAVNDRVTPWGGVEAVFAEDTYNPLPWLRVNGGLRFTHFDGEISESSVDPRVGAQIRLPHLQWVLHGFYGRYYQPPPLATVGGPILELANQQGFGFLPLKGERDEQWEAGVSVPFRKWRGDVSYFQTKARNFFDHDVLGNSNIFFPLTIARAHIHGTEVTVNSPTVFGRAQWHLVFSRQWAEGSGGITGGLTDFSPPEEGSFFLDHDQRTTIATGMTVNLPWRTWVSANFAFGSGFLYEDGPQHLGSNNTVDLAVTKSIGERWSIGASFINVADHRFLIDAANTFGGTHWSEPLQVTGEVKYRFKF
ncbi:TonB-dependent receptor [Candidatus Koribacter versatilis Ellin345]|uniref:TonB-dependent receptor n=1 Tax=Koribacter versatilis (strain Ellin345) TaxID=204669 RepID=Q1IQ58_KORVE|nr:TonB-dependent receptor [Candidatus Koribacter versatilis]ABF40992.1 TonB-dependent receptor [Candidatus Koribacter versatilis Ellin345]